jgi:hypothetical protein
MREKPFEEMTLNEVFDLEDRYSANAGRSVVSKEGIARRKRELARSVGHHAKPKRRRAVLKAATA